MSRAPSQRAMTSLRSGRRRDPVEREEVVPRPDRVGSHLVRVSPRATQLFDRAVLRLELHADLEASHLPFAIRARAHWSSTTKYSGTFSSSIRCISRRSRLNVSRRHLALRAEHLERPERASQPNVQGHPLDHRHLVALLVEVVADDVDRSLLVAYPMEVDREVDPRLDENLGSAREVVGADVGGPHQVRMAEERGSILGSRFGPSSPVEITRPP